MGPEEHGPVAGWYADPEGREGVRRYWDGAQWTDRYDSSTGDSGTRPSPSSADQIDRRFRSLYIVAQLFTVLAWIVLIFGTLGVIAATIEAGQEETVSTAFDDSLTVDNDAEPAVIAIVGGLGVLVYALLFFAAAAIIRLALRVEDNTFRTAAAVEQMLRDRA